MNNQIPKRYPQSPNNPLQGRPLKTPMPPSPKRKTGFKAFVISIVAISLITAGFIAKKKYEENKKLTTLEELQEKQAKNVELNIEYITSQRTFKKIRKSETQLVDIREAEEFRLKHIESSINIPLSRINEKIDMINRSKEIVIIDREETRLGKVFADHLKNEGANVKYLEGGILGYSEEGFNLVSFGNPTLTEDLVKVTSISAEQIRDQIKSGKLFVFLDTRPTLEFKEDNIEGSLNIPLEELEAKKRALPLGTILVYDSDAIRSFQAAVRLYDMNIIGAYNSLDKYETLKQVLMDAAQAAEQEDANQQTSTDEKPEETQPQ